MQSLLIKSSHNSPVGSFAFADCGKLYVEVRTMEPFELKHSERGDSPTVLEITKWVKEIPGLTVGFTTRIGGVSSGGYDSLNCALHVDDHKETVITNRQRLAQVSGLPFETWTCAEQIHGNRVHIVTANDRGKGRCEREDAIANADALLTVESGLWLTSFYADCVPLLFVDPATRVVGLAHAGWKGTVEQIAIATVNAMVDQFGCKKEHIRAAIGPSIGKCCYEVDERVIHRIRSLYEQLQLDIRDVLTPVSDGHAMVDLREINRQLLIKAGILTTNIECTNWCTGCRTDLFYSHRMEGGQTGRMASWIGWLEEGMTI